MKLLVFCVCLWLAGCGQTTRRVALFEEPADRDSIAIVDFSDLDLTQTPKFSDIFDTVGFVKLETREDALIGTIDKIIAVDDKFVILDTSMAKGVFVFDSQGRFLNRIGNSGRGPKEYDLPNDMTYDRYNEELIVNNYNRQTLMCFKLDGTFVREIRLDFYFGTLSVVDSNTIAIYRNNKGRGENDYNLILIDREGNVKNNFLPIDRTTDLLSPPCKMAFFSYGDSLQFSPRYSRMVYDIDEKGLTPKYRLDFGERNIPYGLLKGITSRDLDEEISANKNYVYSIGYAETADHLIFRFVYNRMVHDCYY
ncbi:MAG: 6-bladed beta-propeller, partial [Lachnoclostridium sp.]|nr:6-bladed beta-propeller [Lachnoclostridium sp.]